MLFALFGLGNPGKKYQTTRHNIGFLFLDYYAEKFGIPFVPGKGDYFFSAHKQGDREVLLVKPTTYMNLSGQAVRQVMEATGITAERILVVYDDFQLPFGTLRFRKKGSDGGHNGIKSIIWQLQSDVFNRLRLGIGPPPEDSVVDFVLSPFDEASLKQLETVFAAALDGVNAWMAKDINHAMNHYNKNVLE